MHQAANAYARVSQASLSPRELEATALMKAAMRLQAVRDDWASRRGELSGALDFNQKLWTILATAATDDAGALPSDIRQGVSDLAGFVFNHTFAIIAEPDAAKLGPLVNINRELAAGLRGTPMAA